MLVMAIKGVFTRCERSEERADATGANRTMTSCTSFQIIKLPLGRFFFPNLKNSLFNKKRGIFITRFFSCKPRTIKRFRSEKIRFTYRRFLSKPCKLRLNLEVEYSVRSFLFSKIYDNLNLWSDLFNIVAKCTIYIRL